MAQAIGRSLSPSFNFLQIQLSLRRERSGIVLHGGVFILVHIVRPLFGILFHVRAKLFGRVQPSERDMDWGKVVSASTDTVYQRQIIYTQVLRSRTVRVKKYPTFEKDVAFA